MLVADVAKWFGLICLIIASICIALIGLKNSVWFGTPKSVTSELKSIDVKFAKVAGLFFILSVIFFVIGLSL